MQDLGEWLRREREARGISRAQLQAATKITLCYIAAIEEGRMEFLPQEPYKRAFISTYVRGLGMDPKPVLQKYQEIVDKGNAESIAGAVAYNQPQATPERVVRTLVAVFNGTMEWLGM